MTTKIIKVEPVKKYFSISWNIGRRCNYDCMYCPSSLHDKVSKNKTLIDLKNYWNSILQQTHYKNLKYRISFSGGELSINKNFLPFLEWLKSEYADNIAEILVTSNASASYNYYKKLLGLVDVIGFSVHSEHFNEKKFFSMVCKLHKEFLNKTVVYVNIMNEFWNQDRIPLYEKICQDHNIGYSINEINYSVQTRSFPIMKGQLNLETTKS